VRAVAGVAASVAIAAGVALVGAGPAGAAPTSVTFDYTGTNQTWVVPAGVTEITVDLSGAQGGDNAANGCSDFGGLGGRTVAVLPVTPGDTLTIVVGGRGGGSNDTGQGVGGFNGGGDAGVTALLNIYGAGGGGASDVRIGGSSLADRVIIGGGGGGVGAACTGAGNGGDGGGADGTAGVGGGGGGTQSAGGAGDPAGVSGVLGAGGHGGDGTQGQPRAGGGGGGGLYGGGGGSNAATSNESTSSGGGGSGLCPAACLAFDAGVNAGNGGVTITYTVTTPTTPTTAPPAAEAATVSPSFTG